MHGAINRTHAAVRDQLFEAIFAINEQGKALDLASRRLVEEAIFDPIVEATMTGLAIAHALPPLDLRRAARSGRDGRNQFRLILQLRRSWCAWRKNNRRPRAAQSQNHAPARRPSLNLLLKWPRSSSMVSPARHL